MKLNNLILIALTTLLLSGCKVISAPTISVGDYHGCGITDSLEGGGGTEIKCWGRSVSHRAIVPPQLNNPRSVTSSGDASCAIDADGVHCWGRRDTSKLPDEPEVVKAPNMMVLSDRFACAIENEKVICWGDSQDGRTKPPALVNPFDVSVGMYFACALDDNGATCWGNDDNGWTKPPKLVNPTEIASGPFHTCALDDNGVSCWGGQNWDHTYIPGNLIDPHSLSAGGRSACLIHNQGEVVCWGFGFDDFVDTVPNIDDATQLAVGYNFACAVRAGGEVVCWGSDASEPSGGQFQERPIGQVQ